MAYSGHKTQSAAKTARLRQAYLRDSDKPKLRLYKALEPPPSNVITHHSGAQRKDGR